LYATALADLDSVAVDVEHIPECVRIGRVEEANHIDEILEVGVERIVVGECAAIASRPA
jgi:ethanolamine ammonia-lyase small subunit